VLVVIVLIIGGVWYYYSHNNSMSPSPTGAMGTNGSPNQGNLGGTNTGAPEQPGTSASQNLILGVESTPALGQFLTASNGMTLYMYTKDTKDVSNCTGQCATNWPPYTVASSADINVSAATSGRVGTIVRADGKLQVTYNGQPLYFWINDKNPGDTTGQGVGGVWYVVKP